MKLTPTLGGAYSGSLGGFTASHNRGGPYFRRRAKPTNPNTTRQVAVRVIFAALASDWGASLTGAQRQGWRDYAQATPTTDTLGQVLILTGQQAFVGANLPRVQAGLPIVSDAPVVFNHGEPPTTFTDTSVTTPLPTDVNTEGTFDATPSAAGTMLVYMGRPVSAATTFYRGPYQLESTHAVLAAAATWGGSVSASTYLAAEFPTVGQRRPWRARMTYDDGRLSAVLEEIRLMGTYAPP